VLLSVLSRWISGAAEARYGMTAFHSLRLRDWLYAVAAMGQILPFERGGDHGRML
jgi:hypothetical protein